MIELAATFLGVGILLLIAVPALIVLAAVGMALSLVLFVALLPFKLLILGFGGLLEAAGALFKMAAGFVLFVVAGALALTLFLIPAIPGGLILLAAGLAWMMARAFGRARNKTAQT